MTDNEFVSETPVLPGSAAAYFPVPPPADALIPPGTLFDNANPVKNINPVKYQEPTKETIWPLANRLASHGLSQLYDNLLQGPFAMLSASRGANATDEEKAENKQRSRELRDRLRELGYGYVDSRGMWKENEKNPLSRFVRERSYFVPGMSEEHARELGKEYQQDAVLYGNAGQYGLAYLDSPVGDEEQPPMRSVTDDFHVINRDRGDNPGLYSEICNKEFALQNPVEMTDEVPDKPPENITAHLCIPLARYASAGLDPAGLRCYSSVIGKPPPDLTRIGIVALPRVLHFERWTNSDPWCYLPFRYVALASQNNSKNPSNNSNTRLAELEEQSEPSQPKSLDLYVSRTDGGTDGQPQLQSVPFTATHDDYVRSLSRQALFSGNALGAAKHIMDKPYNAQRDGLSSVYVDKSGTVHVINPHGHTISAYTAIRDNLPPEFAANRETLPKSGLDFRDLTRLSGGIMRGQFYPHGVGMSVDLQNPPTPQQIRAMEDYHATTSGDTFVAEIYDGQDMVGRTRSIADLRRVLAKAGGEDGPRSMDDLRRDFAGLRQPIFDVGIDSGFGGSVGGRIGG